MLLHSIPPGPDGDPVLAALSRRDRAPLLARMDRLSLDGRRLWRPGGRLGRRDHRAEAQHRADRGAGRGRTGLARISAKRNGVPVQIFRLAGIYGPGRSVFDKLRAGTARRIEKDGQVFNRIHVEDIASVLEASIARPRAGAIYNVADDEPAAPGEVVDLCRRTDRASSRRRKSPSPRPTSRRWRGASTRAAGASRNQRIKSELGVKLRYPTYRDGLRALAASLQLASRARPRGDGGFEAAQILLARLAMVAVLDQSQLDIVAAEEIDKLERVVPGHIRIAHALQDAHRQLEFEAGRRRADGCGPPRSEVW